MSTASATKVTVIVNAGGQIAAASRFVEGADSDVVSGMVAGLGQTLLELDVPADVAHMEGEKLFSHLAEHAAVKSAAEHVVAPSASGVEITTGTA